MTNGSAANLAIQTSVSLSSRDSSDEPEIICFANIPDSPTGADVKQDKAFRRKHGAVLGASHLGGVNDFRSNEQRRCVCFDTLTSLV